MADGDERLFGRRMAIVREIAGWTYEEVAESVGVSITQLWRIEHSRSQPSWLTALAISDLLGMGLRQAVETTDHD